MGIKTIYLRLTGTNPNYQLQWSYDQVTWAKVQSDSPSTEVKGGDELDWSGDSTIDKIKIKFNKGNIISDSGISGNDTKKPKGTVPSGVANNLTDSYTIKVKPAAGGAQKEYDPDLKTPNDEDL